MDIMGELLASQNKKYTSLSRGQQVEGKVVAISAREITLDLGAKSEGVISTRELGDSVKDLKPGDKIKAYVVMPENEYGQIILSHQQIREDRGKKTSKGYPRSREINWSKFAQAKDQKSKLQGKVADTNKGGLIVEVEGSRGFIPHSQLGLEFLGKETDELIGQNLTVSVIEVDESSNKLVFSQKEQSMENFEKLTQKFPVDEVVKGKIINVFDAGVVVLLEGGVEGFLKASKTDTKYETGKNMSFLVDSIDKERRRVNLAPFVTSTAGLIYK